MSEHQLVLVSFGPVQGFIATARKGSDLWAGSRLLSDLTRAAAVAALDAGAELIMPASGRAELLDPDTAVSNKVMAIVEGDPQVLAGEMTSAARQALSQRVDASFEAVRARAGRRAPVDFDLARRQVEGLLESSWASVPVDPLDDSSFRSAAASVGHLLAATRSHRPFGPAPARPGRPKSSLDPAMESVVQDRCYARRRGGRDRLFQQLKACPGERLSGIDLVKRFWGADLDDHRVPSTSHIASYSLRRSWLGADDERITALRAAVQRFVDDLGNRGVAIRTHRHLADEVLGGIDGHVLYPGRMVDLGLEGAGLEDAEAALRRLHARLRGVLGDAYRPLSPYYAIVMADGDHIGAALASLGRSHRREVSGWLSKFARRARTIVAEHHGHCTYVGGDDVLALVPCQQALAVGRALRDAFQGIVGDRLAALPGVGNAPTLSAGVCVAHHLDPIADALAAVRRAEADAKQVYGRDALCVTVRKRSGAPRTVGMKWGALAAFESMFSLLDEPGGEEALPRGLSYVLRELAARVGPPGEGAAAWDAEDSALQRSLARGVALQKRLSGDAMAALQIDETEPFHLDLLADRVEVARTLAALDGGRA